MQRQIPLAICHLAWQEGGDAISPVRFNRLQKSPLTETVCYHMPEDIAWDIKAECTICLLLNTMGTIRFVELTSVSDDSKIKYAWAMD